MARTTSPEAIMGDTLAGELRRLGTRGVLVQMAQRGQIIDLRCEMPKCYCHKGRGYFEPRSTPLPDWAPSPDHYPTLKADGGHLVPWNVRLSHVLCNREDYGWRMRSDRCLRKGCHSTRSPRTSTTRGYEDHMGAPRGRQQRAESVRLLGSIPIPTGIGP